MNLTKELVIRNILKQNTNKITIPTIVIMIKAHPLTINKQDLLRKLNISKIPLYRTLDTVVITPSPASNKKLTSTSRSYVLHQFNVQKSYYTRALYCY